MESIGRAVGMVAIIALGAMLGIKLDRMIRRKVAAS